MKIIEPFVYDCLLNEKYHWKKEGNEISIKKDIISLKKGKPLAYVIGNIPFLNTVIDLSYKPLIPRAETEFWVEYLIKKYRNKSFNKVLDIFSGSGCIGVALAKNNLVKKIDFSDSEVKNIKQIKKNCSLNKVLSKRNIIRSNLFENISSKYNLIVANPPYCALDQLDMVQKEVAEYEPSEALFGGEDGLYIIKKFVEEVSNYLLKNGEVWMEFGYKQESIIKKIINKAGFKNIKFYKDQYKKWRYVVFKQNDSLYV